MEVYVKIESEVCSMSPEEVVCDLDAEFTVI